MSEEWKPVEPNWKPIGELAESIVERLARDMAQCSANKA